MKPSSSSTLASATLRFVAGISTAGRSISLALRMRVSMSAIGSVIMVWSSLSPGYQDALRTPGIRPLLANKTPGKPGAKYRSLRLVPERHPEQAEQLAGLVVLLRVGDERDVHPLRERHLVRVDLGEDQLLGQPHAVVAVAVERLRVD